MNGVCKFLKLFEPFHSFIGNSIVQYTCFGADDTSMWNLLSGMLCEAD